jgi:16S rRNA (uracil1498-N3)-methyltransferase
VVEPLFISPIASDVSIGSKVRISGAEAKHALTVKRMQPGEAIAISDGLGTKLRGKVALATKEFLEIEVSVIENLERPKPALALIQALAKGDRDELALQACTELGIDAVIPWQAERSVSIWKQDKKIKGQLRWQAIATEAAKQSLRAFIPTVEPVLGTEELVERVKSFDTCLVLDPTAKVSITSVELSASKSIAIVVGPEGGISEQELQALQRAGGLLVSLGSGILRTSTAGVAVVSYLQAKLGNWS